MIGSSNGDSFENRFHQALGINHPREEETSQNPVINSPQEEDGHVFLVRHGSTDSNEGEEKPKIRGWSPIPLNDDGIEDAHKAAESLKDKGITSIVSSDLNRAKQTANIIGRELDIKPTFTDLMRTWHMGEKTGQPEDDYHGIVSEYINKPDTKIPGGESFNEFKDRTLQGVSYALNQDKGGNVAIITHHAVDRLMKAWDYAGQPSDGTTHTPTFLEKGEKPGGHEEMSISPSIHTFEERWQGPPLGLPIDVSSFQPKVKGSLKNPNIVPWHQEIVSDTSDAENEIKPKTPLGMLFDPYRAEALPFEESLTPVEEGFKNVSQSPKGIVPNVGADVRDRQGGMRGGGPQRTSEGSGRRSKLSSDDIKNIMDAHSYAKPEHQVEIREVLGKIYDLSSSHIKRLVKNPDLLLKRIQQEAYDEKLEGLSSDKRYRLRSEGIEPVDLP